MVKTGFFDKNPVWKVLRSTQHLQILNKRINEKVLGFPLIGFRIIRGVYCRLWDSSCGKKLLLSKVLVSKWIRGTTQQRPLPVQGAAWCGLRPRCSKHDKPNQGLANNFSSSFAALQLVLIAHIFFLQFCLTL